MLYLVLLLVPLLKVNTQAFDLSTCGSQKGCLVSPPTCNPLTGNCRILASYVQVNDRLQMELYGPLAGDGFVALGFSDDEQMGDDTVVWCGYQGGQTRTGLAYNPGKSNVQITTAGIQQVHNTSFTNGNVYCKLSQPLNANVQNVKRLDKSYFPLMATGPLNNGNLQYHSSNRFVLGKTDFTAYRQNSTEPIGTTTVATTTAATGTEKVSIFQRLINKIWSFWN